MMNKPFIHEDFLLETKEAKDLYHLHAKMLPIIDYHCHVPPADIAENRQFENLTRIWLWGDHYKWRAMRTCGVDEEFITGKASDWEKFEKWAETVPKTLRNPLYHWTHLELRKPFGITDRLLSPATARSVWDECNEKLATPEFSVRGIIQSMNVETICTTDDPVDDLRHHKQLAKDTTFPVGVYPAFRADKAMAVENPAAFALYMAKLGETTDIDIRSFTDLLEALHKRHDYFHEHNSRLSDHGLETMYVENYTKRELDQILLKLLQKQSLSPGETLQFKSAVLYELAVMDWEKGWTQQFHLGTIRNVNSRKLRILGPDTGYDSIGDLPIRPSSSTVWRAKTNLPKRFCTISTPGTMSSSRR
jgi:glucuronate isomerase